ncbi:MAG: glycosyltransferase family 2 protein [Candidatus Zixiibacteriota bacterium]
MVDPGARVGVVIVTYNSADDIEPCLESVRSASARPLQVVVVDNASTDGTPNLVRDAFPEATLLTNSTNRFYAAANNQGLAVAGGEYVLLLNPDVLLPVGGIDALVRELNAHPDCVAIAPKLIDPRGRRQASLREFPGFDTLWFDLLGLSLLFPKSPRFGRWRMGWFDGATSRRVDQPMASCLLIRRGAIAEIGLFDERYPMFFNDVDWCRRVADRGWGIWYTADVAARHRGGASTRQAKIRMIWMAHTAYLRYLRQYHCPHAGHRLLLWLSVPPVYLAAMLRSVWWRLRSLW